MVCGKDACLDCNNLKWWHKYSDWCCKTCWEAGKERRRILDAAEDIFMEIVDREFVVWRRDVELYWKPLIGDDEVD